MLHAIECRDLRSVAHGGASILGLADGACASLLRDQQIGLGLRFGKFLLQLTKSGLQIFDLRLLIGDLFGETTGKLAIALDTMQSGAREFVVFLADGELGLAHPFGRLLRVFFLLGFEQVLVSDGDRHLRLDLQKLVLHV